MRLRCCWTVLAALLALSSCGATSAADAGTPAQGTSDAGAADAGGVDAGAVDAGGVDAGAVDAGGLDAGPPSELDLLGRACTADADCGTLKCRLDPDRNRAHQVCTIPCDSTDACQDRFVSSAMMCVLRPGETLGFCAFHCSTRTCPAGQECMARLYCDRPDRKKCTGSPLACADQPDCYGSGCSRCAAPCAALTDEFACTVIALTSNGGVPECTNTGSCSGGAFSPQCASNTSSMSCTSPCSWSPGCKGVDGSDGLYKCAAASDAECSGSCTVQATCRGTPRQCNQLDTLECLAIAGCTVQ